MCFSKFFQRFRRDVKEFGCAFWAPFWDEIRWCTGVAKGFVFCILSWQWQQQQLEQKSVCISYFSKDSEGTLESFVVTFGRLFGTKLGGVLAFVVLLFWAGLG